MLLILAFLLAEQPAPRPQSKVVESVVKVEDRSISLPPLPLDGPQARARFKAVHGQLGTAMADLTLSLQALYGRPEAAMRLAADLSVPAEAAEEGAALLGVIEDAEYGRLERTFLDTWKGWQAALVEGGLAKRVQPPGKTTEVRSKAFEAARQKGLGVLQSPSRKFQQVSRLDAGYRAKDEEDGFSEAQLQATPTQAEERAVAPDSFTKQELDTQNRLALTHLLLPDLQATWTPLVEHLNAAALRVVNREQSASPVVDATLDALRIHARIAVLERFRRDLWYCDVVWCQIATEEPPAPPRRLGPARP
jgi:hypothetical protein